MLRYYMVYMIRLLIWPTVLVTASLTAIIWLLRALRYIDFIVNRGLSVGDFMYITSLLVPALLMMLLPISLFIAVLFTYNRLMNDSELVVMKSAGLSRMQIATPAIVVSLGVCAICYLISLYAMPLANRNFNDMRNFIRDNYASVLLQEEVFNHPVDGLTVFVRERDNTGNLKGILVHDARGDKNPVTMTAEEGTLVNTAEGPRFYLRGGIRQELRKGTLSWLRFDNYTLDISFYTGRKGTRKMDGDEMFVGQIFTQADSLKGKQRNKLLAEAHRRLSWPLYCVAVSFLALGILLSGDHSRRGQGKRTMVASVSVAGILLGAISLSNIVVKNAALYPLLYVAVLLVAGAGIYLLLRDRPMKPRSKARNVLPSHSHETAAGV